MESAGVAGFGADKDGSGAEKQEPSRKKRRFRGWGVPAREGAFQRFFLLSVPAGGKKRADCFGYYPVPEGSKLEPVSLKCAG